jgi:zinc/manganese transport system substrate-binding protein
LRVVATVPDLAAVAQEIGGKAVAAEALAKPTQDPHFVDAKPSLALALNRADLLLVAGLDLEIGWVSTLLVGARNSKIQRGSAGFLDTSTLVQVRDVASGPVDRSHGDIHPSGNPHYMSDPREAASVAKGIARKLAELDPGNRPAYEAGAAAFVAKLEAARKGWEQRLAPLRGARIVSYHRTLSYLCGWLGLEEVAYLEPKPGIPPNPRHVAALLAHAKDKKVRAVLQEAYYPDNTSKLVAAGIPAPLVTLPGGTDVAKGQSYVDHMGQIVAALARALVPAEATR